MVATWKMNFKILSRRLVKKAQLFRKHKTRLEQSGVKEVKWKESRVPLKDKKV